MVQIIDGAASVAVLVPRNVGHGVRPLVEHVVRFMGAQPGRLGLYSMRSKQGTMVAVAERNSSEAERITKLGFHEYKLPLQATTLDMIRAAKRIALARSVN